MRFKFTWHQPHTNWERADVEIYALLILLSAYAIPFFYLLSWDTITSAQAICFFFMMTSFLWASFLLKWNFWVCKSCILSCNINHQHPASQCYKYNTMTSSSPFLSQGRKTQLLAFFTVHLTYAQSSRHSSHAWKRSKLFSFTSWIIKKIQNTLIWWSCNPLKLNSKELLWKISLFSFSQTSV